MSVIAIIPIRSGSKGLPNKNVLFFNGRPLVCSTIQALIDSERVQPSNIYVSTDSEWYISMLKKYFPNVSFHKRPDKFASDSATTADFLTDFLLKFNAEDTFILCQATSPLRDSKDIQGALNQYEHKQDGPVVSVVKNSEPDVLLTTMNQESELVDIVGIDQGYHRQTKREKYLPNGAIYISNVGKYLESKSFFLSSTSGYIMSAEKSIDIDTVSDFSIAEALSDRLHTHQVETYQLENVLDELSDYQIHPVRILIDDGRYTRLRREYRDSGYFTSKIFDNITIKQLNVALKSSFFENCAELVVYLGTYSLLWDHTDTVCSQIDELMENCETLKIKLTIAQVPPVLLQPQLGNEKIALINRFIKSKSESVKVISVPSVIVTDIGLNFMFSDDGLHITF